MKTKSYKNTDLDKKWLLLDARDETLGRLSSKIASILMGKNKYNITNEILELVNKYNR